MSRGLGAVERSCLEVLRLNGGGPLDSAGVAELVHRREAVTESEGASVRRALRRLASAGLVVGMGRRYRDGRRRWALPGAAAEQYRRDERTGWGHAIPKANRHLLDPPHGD